MQSGAASGRGPTDDVWEVSPKADGVAFDVLVINPHQSVTISREVQLIPKGLR